MPLDLYESFYIGLLTETVDYFLDSPRAIP